MRPVIYRRFWHRRYRPYVSTYYYNYYPTYFTAWNAYPTFSYINNVNVYINLNNHYNYVNYRRCHRAQAYYAPRRNYGYEVQNPNYSFSHRNVNVVNRYELDNRRGFVVDRNDPNINNITNNSTKNIEATPTRSYENGTTRPTRQESYPTKYLETKLGFNKS